MPVDSNITGVAIQVRDRFGALAIQRHFITQEQLDEAVSVQRAAAKAGFRKRLGDILIKKGYLTQTQVQEIISGQTTVVSDNKHVAGYEIISKLGEGGMGAVFKARQTGMDRFVALKILSPKLAKNMEFRERFIREARAVAKLNHPNIVAGIDVGSEMGLHYFAMEFVPGETLGSKITACGGKLSEREALTYAHQIALALQHAHQHGILHRDVKPENVLVDKDGTVKLGDLGLARSVRHDNDAAMSSVGMAIGTPYYISPEQARGESNLTPGTDLYSLGASLFYMLTGKHVFEGPTSAVIMAKHVAEEPPDPCAEVPQLSKATSLLVLKLLNKDPKDRYKDGKALATALQDALVTLGEFTAAPDVSGVSKVPTPVFAMPIGHQTTKIKAPRITRRRKSTDVSGGLLATLGIVGVLALVILWAFPAPKRPSFPNNAPNPKPERTPDTGTIKPVVEKPSAKTVPDKLPVKTTEL